MGQDRINADREHFIYLIDQKIAVLDGMKWILNPTYK